MIASRARRAWNSMRGRVLVTLALAVVAVILLIILAGPNPLAPTQRPGDYLTYASFELTIWRTTPDSMTYTESDTAGHSLYTYTTSRPDLVSRWYAYVNDEQPAAQFDACGYTLNEPPPVHHVYVFRARGAVVETATSDDQSYLCYFYTRSAGATHDPFRYVLTNPHASPRPPPVGHQAIP